MYQAAYVGCILDCAAVFLIMALKARRNYFFDIQSCSHALAGICKAVARILPFGGYSVHLILAAAGGCQRVLPGPLQPGS